MLQVGVNGVKLRIKLTFFFLFRRTRTHCHLNRSDFNDSKFWLKAVMVSWTSYVAITNLSLSRLEPDSTTTATTTSFTGVANTRANASRIELAQTVESVRRLGQATFSAPVGLEKGGGKRAAQCHQILRPRPLKRQNFKIGRVKLGRRLWQLIRQFIGQWRCEETFAPGKTIMPYVFD